MARLLTVVNERKRIRDEYRRHLEQEFIKMKKKEEREALAEAKSAAAEVLANADEAAAEDS